jgi:hypothetical protein
VLHQMVTWCGVTACCGGSPSWGAAAAEVAASNAGQSHRAGKGTFNVSE